MGPESGNTRPTSKGGRCATCLRIPVVVLLICLAFNHHWLASTMRKQKQRRAELRAPNRMLLPSTNLHVVMTAPPIAQNLSFKLNFDPSSIPSASRIYFHQLPESEAVVLTYANNIGGRLCDYMATHVLQQVRTHILGFDPSDDPPLPSKRPREKEYHIGSRLLMQAKACAALPPSALVVLGDSMDVMLQGNSSSLLHAFRDAAVDWLPVTASGHDPAAQLPRGLAAAEADCWPPEYQQRYNAKYAANDATHRRLAPQTAAHKYLNGGGFMGTAREALRWLTEAMSERPDWEVHENRWNAQGTDYENFVFGSPQWLQWRKIEPNPPYMRRPDQIMLHDMFLDASSYNVYLDSGSRVWQCMQVTIPYANSKFRFDEVTGMWLNTDSNVYPNYFHYNGPCKYVLHDSAASLKRVRNNMIRAQLKRRNRWSEVKQHDWLQKLSARLSARASSLSEDDAKCVKALGELGSPLPAKLNAEQTKRIDSECIDAVQPVVNRAELDQFVRFFDRGLGMVSQKTIDALFSKCSYRDL